VTVDQIIKVLLENADKAKTLVMQVVPRVGADANACGCGCRSALQYALITAPEARDAAMKEKLQAIAGRVLKG
jgi:5'-methylthioadenosine phosphorylase